MAVEKHEIRKRLVEEIVTLRMSLGLFHDRHWMAFLQQATVEEMHEILAGLRELAHIQKSLAEVPVEE